MDNEMNWPTALVYTLAITSYVQANTATTSVTGILAIVPTTSVTVMGSNSTSNYTYTAQASNNASKTTSAAVISLTSTVSNLFSLHMSTSSVISLASRNTSFAVSVASTRATSIMSSIAAQSFSNASVATSVVPTSAALFRSRISVQASSINTSVASTNATSNRSSVAVLASSNASVATSTSVAVQASSDVSITTSAASTGVTSTGSRIVAQASSNASITDITSSVTSSVIIAPAFSDASGVTSAFTTSVILITPKPGSSYTHRSQAASSNSVTVSMTSNSTTAKPVSVAGNSNQLAATTPMLSYPSSSSVHPLGTSSTSSLLLPTSSTSDVTGSASPRPTFSLTVDSSMPSQQVSVVPSSPSSTAAILVASSTLNPSPAGHSSETSRPSSFSTDSQNTQVDRPASVSSLKEMTSVMTSFLVVSVSNSNSSALPSVNASLTSPFTTPTLIPSPGPTFPPEGTKIVNIQVSLEITFKKEYNDPNSLEYKKLEANLTSSLTKTYESVDGFVGVSILFFRRGSVICSFIVILTKNSKVENEELKAVLDKANKEGKFGYDVIDIKVEYEPTVQPKEKLYKWALITMIVLGSLSFVFLMTVICMCIKYRRSISGENGSYYISTEELGMHTYETVPRARMDDKNPTLERRIIGSHTNPTYGSNGALAD